MFFFQDFDQEEDVPPCSKPWAVILAEAPGEELQLFGAEPPAFSF